jgi:sorbose reductase
LSSAEDISSIYNPEEKEMPIPYLDLESRKSVKDLFSYAGKTVLVTAAAGQIGFMSSAGFAEMGADVVLSDLEKMRDQCERYAQEIGEKFGTNCVFIPADVTDADSVCELYDEIGRRFEKLDAVHSNTGVSFAGDDGDLPLEIWEKTLRINATGTLLVNQGACRLMRKSGGGAIVNTSSMSASIINRVEDPFRHEVAYPVSKAGVLHLTRGLAMEYLRYGIRVNAVSPGYVYSATHEKSTEEKIAKSIANVPMKRFGRADEITGAVLYLCSELASYVTGAEIRVDGGYTIW